MTKKMRRKDDKKNKKPEFERPNWSMALPGLLNAVKSDKEEWQQGAVNQLMVLCTIMDLIYNEAMDNDAFKKRIEHLGIKFKMEGKK